MNNLCPICDKPYSIIGVDMMLCEEDKLAVCPGASKTSSYNGDYLLHYKLYDATDMSRELNEARWEFVISSKPRGPILDFGCGASSFEKYKPVGQELYCYDPYFKCDYGFLQVDIDTITFWDSFEHIRRISMIPLIGARQIFISLPIIEEGARLYHWKHYIPDEHIWCFTHRALTRLLGKWGYEFVIRKDFEIVLGREDIWSYLFVNSTG